MADHSANADPVEAVQPDELGLAGAEQRLFNLNLNAGQLSVQRQIMQLRVDYLTQLNTQTMLLAGTSIYMLSSLELEQRKAAAARSRHQPMKGKAAVTTAHRAGAVIHNLRDASEKLRGHMHGEY